MTKKSISVIRYGFFNSNIKVHQVISRTPFLTNAYVIEYENCLSLVDALSTYDCAGRIFDYIKSLHKPLKYIFLTHPHYDHYKGLEFFYNIDIYSSARVIQDMINKNISIKCIPNKEVGESMLIEGVEHKFINLKNTHCENHIVIAIPEVKLIFTGDLLSASNHLLPYSLKGYVEGLIQLQNFAKKDYTHFAAGHDYQLSDIFYLQDNIDYLKECFNIYEKSSSLQELDNSIKNKFPNKLLNNYVYILYSTAMKEKFLNTNL